MSGGGAPSLAARLDARTLRQAVAELDFLDLPPAAQPAGSALDGEGGPDANIERLSAIVGSIAGVDRVELRSYGVDATARHFDWTFEPTPQPRGAELYLLRPDGSEELLAAGDGVIEGLVGSLRATDPGGEVFEVIDVGAGTSAGDYQRVRKFGERVAFAWGQRPRAVFHEALAVRGAAGVLLGPRPERDETRAPRDPLFAPQLGAASSLGGKRPFAFRLGPRAAERLRGALSASETTRVRACVRVQLPARERALLSACIDGSDLASEEVLLLCDLARPQSTLCVAATLQVMRAIAASVVAGQLAPPRRTLRFVFSSGLAATVAWLADERETRPAAALQLSMPLTRRRAQLLVQDTPPSAPTFVADLVERQLAAHGGQHAAARVPYRAGSSAAPFVDHSVAVPMILLAAPAAAGPGERRSDAPLELCLALARGAASSVAALASLGEADLPRLIAASSLAAVARISAHARRLGEALHESGLSAPEAGAALAHVEDALERARASEERVLESIAAYLGAGARAAVPIASANNELRQVALAATRLLHAQILEPFEGDNLVARARPLSPQQRRASALRVRRTFDGPPPLHALARDLDDEGRAWLAHNAGALDAQPAAEILLGFVRADEARSLFDIAVDLEHCCGAVDLKLLWRYLELLARAGLVELAEEQPLGTPQELHPSS